MDKAALVAWVLLGFVLGFRVAQTVYRKLMDGYRDICADYHEMLDEMLDERTEAARASQGNHHRKEGD